jgi:hypothetical protein
MIVSSGLEIGSTETIEIPVSAIMKGECDNLNHEGERGRSNAFEACKCGSDDESRMGLEVRHFQPLHLQAHAITFRILVCSAH